MIIDDTTLLKGVKYIVKAIAYATGANTRKTTPAALLVYTRIVAPTLSKTAPVFLFAHLQLALFKVVK